MIATAPIPLLVTVDVEIAHDRPLRQQREALDDLRTVLAKVPTTWFTTADAAEAFAQPLRRLLDEGHEIGCHGLDHHDQEDYRRLPLTQVRPLLTEATNRIEAALGVRPQVFRGPRMTTSVKTHTILRDLNYRADFSVCSRRFDPWAASRYSWRWLGVGPRPYAPLATDAFRTDPTAEPDAFQVVPLSGMVLPFISGVLFLIGPSWTQRFAGLLTSHARRRRAPLVYLFHSYEFVNVSATGDRRPWHHRLYLEPADARRRANQALVTHLSKDLQLRAMTASTCLDQLKNEGPQ
jgi:peptidoglycan/xylan/chitin deacetylase (PgdA/CDA1 family)